jgi:hypothetical protein
MSNIFALAGAKFYIGTTTAAADETDFAADTYVEVGSSETIGDFGDTAQDIQFTGLGDQRTQHLKGSFDAGTLQLTCARDDADPGQQAMLAAFADPLDYNFKIQWNNKATLAGTGGVTYFRGKVMSKSLTNGTGPNNVARRQFNIGINSEQIEVEPT